MTCETKRLHRHKILIPSHLDENKDGKLDGSNSSRDHSANTFRLLPIVPQPPTGIDRIQRALRRHEPQTRRTPRQTASRQIRRPVRDPHRSSQKVLSGQISHVRPHEKTGGASDGRGKRFIRPSVLEGGVMHVGKEPGEDRATETQSEVEGGTASDPRSAKDLEEGELERLERIDDGLPGRSGAEGGGSEEEARLGFTFHVDGGVEVSFLEGEVGDVPGEDADGVAEAGGQCKRHGVGGISEMVRGEDAGGLPSEAGGEDFADGDFGGDEEAVDKWIGVSAAGAIVVFATGLEASYLMLLLGEEGRSGVILEAGSLVNGAFEFAAVRLADQWRGGGEGPDLILERRFERMEEGCGDCGCGGERSGGVGE
ncbi:hypothetical protein ACHAXS_001853 [Conticribra weissflogii]